MRPNQITFQAIAEEAAQNGWKMTYDLEDKANLGNLTLVVVATWDNAALPFLAQFLQRSTGQEEFVIVPLEAIEENLLSPPYSSFALHQEPLIIFHRGSTPISVLQGPKACEWLIRNR